MRTTYRVFSLALLAVACARQSERVPGENAGMAPSGLAGTKWKLVQFAGIKNTDIRVPAGLDNYSIAFGADGTVAVQADCNRGTGTWSSPEPSVLRFSQLNVTTIGCQSGGMDYKFLKDFEYMAFSSIRNGHLYISLRADRGSYEFEPAS